MSRKKMKKDLKLADSFDDGSLEPDGIVMEDPAAILARRAKEDELCERMRQVVSNFDKYMEDREKKKNEIDEREIDQTVADKCMDTGILQTECTITYRGWSRSEAVVEEGRCFRIFSAESLSLTQLLRASPEACPSCRWLLELPDWREVVEHAQPYAQKTVMHSCPVTRAFPLYAFFLMSVCEDDMAVRLLYRAAAACHFEEPLTLRDFMTVFYNWGFREELLLYEFQPSPVFQEMQRKEEAKANLQETHEKKKSEADTKMDEDAMSQKRDAKKSFPIRFLTMSNTIKFMVNRVHQIDLQAQDQDLVLAGLRMFVAALVDKSVDFALYNLRSLIYKMMDCLEVYKWEPPKKEQLVRTLHIKEFNVYDQYSCVRALVDPSNIKGPVCFAILQILHGVAPDKVVYTDELRASHVSKLPPGPVDWAYLQPEKIFLSLQVLGDCASCVAAADASDPALYGGLLRTLSRMQHRFPKMTMLDLNMIKTLICHLDFLWKTLLRDNLEKQNSDIPFMKYMQNLAYL